MHELTPFVSDFDHKVGVRKEGKVEKVGSLDKDRSRFRVVR